MIKRQLTWVLETPKETEDIVEERDKQPRDEHANVIEPPKEKGRKTLLNPADETQVRKICGHDIKFTNLSKVYWPEDNVTKRDMFNYYYQIAEYILPYLKDRPLSLNRFPGGIHGPSFLYQKDIKAQSA